MPKRNKVCKNLKKFLTSGMSCGTIKKLCDERFWSGVQHHIKNNFQKLEKSAWQIEWDVITYKSSRWGHSALQKRAVCTL